MLRNKFKKKKNPEILIYKLKFYVKIEFLELDTLQYKLNVYKVEKHSVFLMLL